MHQNSRSLWAEFLITQPQKSQRIILPYLSVKIVTSFLRFKGQRLNSSSQRMKFPDHIVQNRAGFERLVQPSLGKTISHYSIECKLHRVFVSFTIANSPPVFSVFQYWQNISIKDYLNWVLKVKQFARDIKQEDKGIPEWGNSAHSGIEYMKQCVLFEEPQRVIIIEIYFTTMKLEACEAG